MTGLKGPLLITALAPSGYGGARPVYLVVESADDADHDAEDFDVAG